MLQIQVSARKKKGETISLEEEKKLLSEITEKYERQTSPYYAAARLWVDGIIDPGETRRIPSHQPIQRALLMTMMHHVD